MYKNKYVHFNAKFKYPNAYCSFSSTPNFNRMHKNDNLQKLAYNLSKIFNTYLLNSFNIVNKNLFYAYCIIILEQTNSMELVMSEKSQISFILNKKYKF